LPLHSLAMEMIEEAVSRHLGQEPAQVGLIGEVPPALPEVVEQAHPDRLNNVSGITLGTEPRGHLPPHDHLQIRRGGPEGLLDSRTVPTVQTLEKGGDLIGAHGSPGDKSPDKSGSCVGSRTCWACKRRRSRRATS